MLARSAVSRATISRAMIANRFARGLANSHVGLTSEYVKPQTRRIATTATRAANAVSLGSEHAVPLGFEHNQAVDCSFQNEANVAQKSSNFGQKSLKLKCMMEVPPWMAYGCVFNSAMLVGTDFIHFAFAASLGLSPLESAGAVNTIVAATSIAALMHLPGAMELPDKDEERDSWRAIVHGRILGVFLGFALGSWPLLWPDEWRMWCITGASKKEKAVPPPTLEEKFVLNTCMEHFPSSLEGPETENVIHRALAARGWDSSNTIFAYSTCPDEVNYDGDSDLVNVMTRRWIKHFTLGGLGGMAFAGKTGWAAFGAHTPENAGHIIVLYGPHVGVGNDGTIGMIRRDGQTQDSPCCGAACAAYQFRGNVEAESANWVKDMQQIALTKMIQPLKPNIDADPVPMKALAFANFEISHSFMREELTSPEKVCAEIAVVGGITVNLPGNLPDRFIPITFDLLDCISGESLDLHSEFGVKRPELCFGSSEKRIPMFSEADCGATRELASVAKVVQKQAGCSDCQI